MEDKRMESPQDQLLAEVLDACMEEQLSFVPPEREIGRMHKFSPEFRQRMEEILRSQKAPSGKKMEKREFIYGFNKLAACVLMLLIVGGMGYLGMHLLPSGSKNYEEEMSSGQMIEETAPTEAPAAEDGQKQESGMEMDNEAISAEQDTRTGQNAGSEASGEEGQIPDVLFMGQYLEAAPRQELPAESGMVKTLVNSPMIARDAQELLVTIGNMEEYPIRYYADMDLEVQIDDIWYLVKPLQEPAEEDRNRIVSLDPGMAQDETIDLTNYTLDYDAQAYRVVTYLDGMTLCAQFQFETEELFGEEEEP
ncbi:MAG: hypothetical protein HFI33_08680 [Lachnospiraceae bacterium]|nr:hypothetical protein [Lachnospiraceae bacterium]